MNFVGLILRVLIGFVFLVSGVEKLLSPYQNFLYVIQAYQMLPSWAEMLVAQAMPWVEFIVGALLVLGLWVPLALKGALVLFGVFIAAVGQALLRGLPLEQCGCFGELIHVAPRVIIVMDSFFVLAVVFLWSRPSLAKFLSVDGYLDR